MTASDHVRYYTAGRKFPRMFGKFSDGTRIPGGPYTSIQFAGGLSSFFVLWQTMSLWGRFGGIANLVCLFAVPFAITFGLRAVRLDRRNPFSVCVSVYAAYTQPKSGKLRGRRVSGAKPRHTRGRVTICATPLTPLPAPLQAQRLLSTPHILAVPPQTATARVAPIPAPAPPARPLAPAFAWPPARANAPLLQESHR